MEEDNVLTPHQKFNGNLDFCRPGPESLTLFSKFQRIQRPKGQGRTKKHLHRPGATTVIGGVCFQNVRKTTSFSSFEQKGGTIISIPLYQNHRPYMEGLNTLDATVFEAPIHPYYGYYDTTKNLRQFKSSERANKSSSALSGTSSAELISWLSPLEYST